MRVKLGFFIVMILTELIVLNSPRAAQGAEKAITLTVPGIQWTMKIVAPGFALDQRGAKPGGQSAYFMASNNAAGVVLSGYMENRGKKGTAKDAMDYFWEGTKKTPVKMEHFKTAESDRMAILEYNVPEYLGKLVNQKNLWAYFTRDQYWINLHLSKMNFRSGDEPFFKSILESVSFEDKSSGKKLETLYRVSESFMLSLDVPCD